MQNFVAGHKIRTECRYLFPSFRGQDRYGGRERSQAEQSTFARTANSFNTGQSLGTKCGSKLYEQASVVAAHIQDSIYGATMKLSSDVIEKTLPENLIRLFERRIVFGQWYQGHIENG